MTNVLKVIQFLLSKVMKKTPLEGETKMNAAMFKMVLGHRENLPNKQKLS